MITRHPRLDTMTRPLCDRPSVYLALLNEQLETRAREHGHAYVTPREAAWLRANGLRQPEHTKHRYSTVDEDVSNGAIARMDVENAARKRTTSV